MQLFCSLVLLCISRYSLLEGTGWGGPVLVSVAVLLGLTSVVEGGHQELGVAVSLGSAVVLGIHGNKLGQTGGCQEGLESWRGRGWEAAVRCLAG